MALSQDWRENARTWQSRYPTAEMQAEYFLLKFVKNGVDRNAVYELMKQFKTFDRRTQGELEENEAMQLLEARNQTKTFHELRQMVADIDLDQNRKLSFLEWACAIFTQSWSELHAPSIDPEELAAAAALEAQKLELLAKASAERDAKAQAELEALQYKEQADWTQAQKDQAKREHEEAVANWHREQKERKEREEAERQAALSKSGVKGAAAKFHYAAKDTKDTTMDNATRLKAEAAARKKQRELEAEKKLADELAEKARIEAERIAEEKAIADREAAEREAELAAAEAARREVEKGTEITRAQQAAYEAEKAEAERIAAEKKAAEAADRAARRAKMAERGNLWNNPAPSPTKGS